MEVHCQFFPKRNRLTVPSLLRRCKVNWRPFWNIHSNLWSGLWSTPRFYLTLPRKRCPLVDCCINTNLQRFFFPLHIQPWNRPRHVKDSSVPIFSLSRDVSASSASWNEQDAMKALRNSHSDAHFRRDRARELRWRTLTHQFLREACRTLDTSWEEAPWADCENIRLVSLIDERIQY